MSNLMRSARERLEVLAFAIPALLYIVIAIPAVIRDRAAINPDGIIYIRKAQFLVAGHIWQSISGYWSPGISWCVALILRIDHKIDPLHAIHGVLAFWGLTWVIASGARQAALATDCRNRFGLCRRAAGRWPHYAGSAAGHHADGVSGRDIAAWRIAQTTHRLHSGALRGDRLPLQIVRTSVFLSPFYVDDCVPVLERSSGL
jgi:hypothetical protein